MTAFELSNHAQAADTTQKHCKENFAYTELWRVDTITTGRCKDLVNIGGIILESTLCTGHGSDHIRAEKLLRSAVLAGNGSNDIFIATIAYNSKTVTVSGAGKDKITIGGDTTRLTLDNWKGC